MLVDIGGGTTDVAIFQDEVIRHTAVIPFGGDVITEDVKEGCSIIKKHAEELKVKFGSALASENRDDEVVAIPGLRGRPAKEITLKNLASIIQARMEEIIEQVYFEIKNSGFEKEADRRHRTYRWWCRTEAPQPAYGIHDGYGYTDWNAQ